MFYYPTIKKLKILDTINKHKEIVKHQKLQFNQDINSLTGENCILIMDFKENLGIGRRPNKTKKDFFNHQKVSYSRSCKDL